MWDIGAVGAFSFPLEFPSRFIDKCGCEEPFEFWWRTIVVIYFFCEGVADGVPGDSEGSAKFGFTKAVLNGADEIGDAIGLVGDSGADGGDGLHDEEDGENF